MAITVNSWNHKHIYTTNVISTFSVHFKDYGNFVLVNTNASNRWM